MEIEFNVNNCVKVKLTEVGLDILRQRHDFDANLAPRILGAFTPPPTDADGWSKFQLWELCNKFGEQMYNGGSVPFETTIRIITDRDKII